MRGEKATIPASKPPETVDGKEEEGGIGYDVDRKSRRRRRRRRRRREDNVEGEEEERERECREEV